MMEPEIALELVMSDLARHMFNILAAYEDEDIKTFGREIAAMVEEMQVCLAALVPLAFTEEEIAETHRAVQQAEDQTQRN